MKQSETENPPLFRRVYVVTRKGIPAAILRDWLLSEDGQRVIREGGYVIPKPF